MSHRLAAGSGARGLAVAGGAVLLGAGLCVGWWHGEVAGIEYICVPWFVPLIISAATQLAGQPSQKPGATGGGGSALGDFMPSFEGIGSSDPSGAERAFGFFHPTGAADPLGFSTKLGSLFGFGEDERDIEDIFDVGEFAQGPARFQVPGVTFQDIIAQLAGTLGPLPEHLKGPGVQAALDLFSGPQAISPGDVSEFGRELLETGFRTDVGPIADLAEREFLRKTIPQLREEFAGQTGTFGTDFLKQVTESGADIQTQLGSLQVALDEAAAGRRLGAPGFISGLEQLLPGSKFLNLLSRGTTAVNPFFFDPALLGGGGGGGSGAGLGAALGALPGLINAFGGGGGGGGLPSGFGTGGGLGTGAGVGGPGFGFGVGGGGFGAGVGGAGQLEGFFSSFGGT